VNALFTALAFAGLIYTVLLQRDQLALQQQEILESGKTQEQLVQRQIDAQKQLFDQQTEFQNRQRKLQEQHGIKLAVAYPVVAASPNVLGSDFGEVRGTAYLLVRRRFASGPEAEQRLERSHR